MTEVRPLRHLATIRVSNVDKKSIEGQVPVRLCNYTDVYYGDRITPELEFMRATATPDQVDAFRLLRGDVIITKDSEDAADIGVPAFVADSAPDLVCGYHLAVLRPAADLTDGRYLYWAMASTPVQDHLSISATGITRYGLRTDSIAGTPIPWWPTERQRAIADLLDANTARIDALIAKKRRLIEVLRERARSRLVELVLGDEGQSGDLSPSGLYRTVPRGWSETSLRHLRCQVQTGPFGSQLHSDEYVEDGWPVVNPMNLVDGGIRAVPTMTVSDDKRDDLARHVLQVGDIVFGRRGEMGRAGLVQDQHAGWLCGTGSLRLRVVPEFIISPYLALLLGTPPARAYFQLASVGSTMDNLNSEIVLGFPTLVPPLVEQRRIIEEVENVRATDALLNKSLVNQIHLLVEHRQALITAAVTGELTAPEVAA